ncbi:hypothetical protein EUTSA_v10029111mg [Eutrema salsugineum]|uniref:Uncharacterized protein n=1 Tax=Eutrema salsugineum TaxID=72664 RepID=V4L3U2_EUTSA|nr:hypothetical protein EUTSA_v10029111mg [Eutrema salsugineum]
MAMAMGKADGAETKSGGLGGGARSGDSRDPRVSGGSGDLVVPDESQKPSPSTTSGRNRSNGRFLRLEVQI